MAAVQQSQQFADLNSFLNTSSRKPVATVWHRGLPIEMSLSKKQGTPLTVVFHGAADPDVRLPWLSGSGVTGSLETSRLSISDPSLYLDPKLNLAWFSGSHIQPDLVEVISKIIKKVAESVGANRVILFGGSGGGFIALRMLEYFPHATAIAMNPQTDIEKYHETHVQRYVDLAWDGDRELMRSSAGTSVFNSVDAARSLAKVVYVQNSNDKFHTAAHLNPFQKRFGGVPGFFLLQDSWREGHTPPPKELIQEILLAAVNEDWDALTTKLGFIPM